jgi:CheY-like chemotaxis protein
MQSLSFEVLLIEDDLGDVELTETALARSKLKINLNVVNDGEEAIAYLRREGQYTDAVRPNLIVILSCIFILVMLEGENAL